MKYIETGLSLICHVYFIYFATLSFYLGKINSLNFKKNSVQFSHSVLSTIDRSRPGFPVPRQLPELAQTYVHRISDAITLCHPHFPPVFSLLQHQGFFPMTQFFASGSQNTGASASASVLLMNIQDLFPSGLNGLIFLQFKELSRVFSNTTVQKHQFFSTQLSL